MYNWTLTHKYLLAKIALILCFLGIRFVGLGTDMSNSDGARWHRRTERFLEAIKHGDLKDTYQHYQPGVSIMWLGVLAEEALFRYQLTYTDQPKTLENADWYPLLDGVSKGVVVLVLALLLYIQITCVSQCFNRKTAVIYGFFMTIEPYLIGIDRWFHLTSLETYFAFTAFLCVLAWRRAGKTATLVVGAAALALAVLSKLTAVAIVPVLLLILLFPIRFANVKWVVIFFGVALGMFVLLFPAVWVAPAYVGTKLVSAVTGAVGDDPRALQLSPALAPFFYLVVLAFKLSPITLLCFVFALSTLFWTRDTRVSAVLAYVVYFFVILSIPVKKIDRYVLELIPPILLISAVGIAKLRAVVLYQVLGGAALLAGCLYIHFFPVPSAYYSPILGGAPAAISAGIYENNGEYFAQAAQYLNAKGRTKYTFIPDNYEAFSYYYKGKAQREFDTATNYIVRSLDIDRTSMVSPVCPEIEKTFGPGDFKAVYIYKCRD